LWIALYNFPSSVEYKLVDGWEKPIERALFAKISFRTNSRSYTYTGTNGVFLSQNTFVRRKLFLRFLYAYIWGHKIFRRNRRTVSWVSVSTAWWLGPLNSLSTRACKSNFSEMSIDLSIHLWKYIFSLLHFFFEQQSFIADSYVSKIKYRHIFKNKLYWNQV